jgi:inorganic pyrophosphatase/exopolyphosphatase
MKPKISFAILSFLLTASVINSYAATIDNDRSNKDRVDRMTDEQKKFRLEEIRTRVTEIKEMDKSGLNKSERKAIKKELREMKKEAKEGKGVFLSVGAIIIIIILVLILVL